MLLLGTPGDEIVTKVNQIGTSGCIVVFVTCPINIRERMKSQVGMAIEHDTVINSPTEIAQVTFNYTSVITCRLMHELREFFYYVSNVRLCQ